MPFIYDARLRCLELRRLLADLVWCYKIILGLVNTDINKLFTLKT